MNDADLTKLEKSVKQLIDANLRITEVCKAQKSLIEKLMKERDTALDYIQAMEAMRK